MRLIDAAEEVRKVARFYRAMETVAEALTAIGSLEQATAEAESVLAESIKKSAEAKASLTEAQTEVAQAKDEAKRIKESASEKAAKKLMDTDVECAKMTAEAETVATRYAADAEGHQHRSAELKKEIGAAQSELDHLTKKIADAKAQIAKLLGGN